MAATNDFAGARTDRTSFGPEGIKNSTHPRTRLLSSSGGASDASVDAHLRSALRRSGASDSYSTRTALNRWSKVPSARPLIARRGAEIYDLTVWLEIDGLVADPATMHRPRTEWQLKQGYMGMIRIQFYGAPVPNPFRKGQAVKLRIAQSVTKESLDQGCGGERLSDMEDRRIHIVCRAAGEKVIKRIPSTHFKRELRFL